MKHIVQSYLTKHYILIDDAGHDSIGILSTKNHIYYTDLLEELISVFFLEKDIIKIFINDWAISFSSEINLDEYWVDERPWFPQAVRVAASTLANELVSVQPMPAPTNMVFHIDTYTETPNKNGRIYSRDAWNTALDEYIQLHNDYEQENSLVDINYQMNPSISVSSRKLKLFGNTEIF